MTKYMVCKFGLYKKISEGEWECIIAECPPRTDGNEYNFEANDDNDAKLIYEVGGYE